MNAEEISKIISQYYPKNTDAFQDAWLHLLETNPEDMHELYGSIRKAKNKQIKEYFRKKREISQFDEHDKLERHKVLSDFEYNDTESVVSVRNDFYRQIAIYFLKEFLSEKQKNWKLRKELNNKKLENSRRWLELRQGQLNKHREILLEKQKKRELLKELSYKKLENSHKWRELRQEQSNKKYETFQKKYELRKKRIDLEIYKLKTKRRRTRLSVNTLQNRLEKIENYLKLQPCHAVLLFPAQKQRQ